MYEVVMPRLSDSMEEGTIIRWLKEDGAVVARGEEFVEIETDKATMTYEADATGTLHITVAEGTTVPVGDSIATIGDVDSAAADGVPTGVGAVSTGAAVTDAPAVAPNGARNGRRTPSVSPVARRMADKLGIDLASLVGSGPLGRVVKADVVAAQDAGSAARPSETAPAPVAAAPAAPVLVGTAPATAPAARGEDLSRTQSLIARRMSESRATIPDFAVEVDVDMSAALELRAQLKALSEHAPSLNDIVVKAAAGTLRRHARVNGSYRDGRFEPHDAVNVGVAVAGEDTLVVPVVRDADVKSLGAIAAETRALAAKVRSREVTAQDLSAGTFTVSNLGMFGIDRFEGIVNMPQAAILCVGRIGDRPVAVDGEVVVRPMMSLTLACDHRIVYGADAAKFLSDIRGLLEQPLSLAL